MTIYESRGFGNNLHLYDKKAPFEYVAQFTPQVVPKGIDVERYKRTRAPYCLSGKVEPNDQGELKRNNDSLLYRDLIFLDYDEIEAGVDFPEVVSKALQGYSWIIYPTIKHTPQKPRYRLVVKPSHSMREPTYRAVVADIAERIGLPFDVASLTWSQLQGLPVTTGDPADYQKIINRGADYPVKSVLDKAPQAVRGEDTPKKVASGRRGQTVTMRVLEVLINGFGGEGGRNVALARFVGLLIGRAVRCDVATAWELVQVANSVTADPLPSAELERTFESIVKTEIRKRGLGLSN